MCILFFAVFCCRFVFLTLEIDIEVYFIEI